MSAMLACLSKHAGPCGVSVSKTVRFASVGCDLAGENQVLAGKAGAIDVVMAVMRAHAGHAGVLERACGAIWNICVNNGAFEFYVCLCSFHELF